MIWAKSCPRCPEDLASDSDRYGRFLSCVQCGANLSGFRERAILAPPTVGSCTARPQVTRSSPEGVAPRRAAYSVMSSHVLA